MRDDRSLYSLGRGTTKSFCVRRPSDVYMRKNGRLNLANGGMVVHLYSV
jgi:hypothetical protein